MCKKAWVRFTNGVFLRELIIEPGKLDFESIKAILTNEVVLKLSEDSIDSIEKSAAVVAEKIQNGEAIYGINTGFGALANVKIAKDELCMLQERIILSHATGVGALLPESTVRLIIALKINCLAQGFSGVSLPLVNALIALYNAGVYPCIPSKGSVGASGDLAPLAHLSLVLIGQGEAQYKNKILPGGLALNTANLKPFKLGPKEGLSLINGTQVSTALAVEGLIMAERLLISAVVIGALSHQAAGGNNSIYNEYIHAVKNQDGQKEIAAIYRHLLEVETPSNESTKVQDPYSLRCQPQVLGACLSQLRFAAQTLLNETNSVSDNPIVVVTERKILSGGNFHAEAVAMASDNLALVFAEIGSLAERRLALLMDHNFSGLPPFLAKNPGLNSGFMIAHVTATALASENKSLAHPACVDTIPTSANQEDHVSMATFAARRLIDMAENTATILAIELFAACQGIDMRRPLNVPPQLHAIIDELRQEVLFVEEDRYFGRDINFCKDFILKNKLLSKKINFRSFLARKNDENQTLLETLAYGK